MDWTEISEKFRWLHPHFRPRPIHWSYYQHCPTSAKNRKPKWQPVNRKYAISQDRIEISEKFLWLHPHFRPRLIHWSYCQHCPTSANNWKIKVATWKPRAAYAISQDWIEISEILRWLRPHFRPRLITSYNANTARRRPTTGNLNGNL